MFADLATSIHSDNVTAGWFTNIITGESIVATRNRPEMMMLAVTELSEAAEAIDGRPDDKLPHLPMFDVEMADFQIRVLDLIGCEVSCGAEMPQFMVGKHHYIELDKLSTPGQLMYVVNRVSEAMEHYRKSRTDAYMAALADALLASTQLCDMQEINWLDMIEQKRAFNRSRADHKIENRLAADGKKI